MASRGTVSPYPYHVGTAYNNPFSDYLSDAFGQKNQQNHRQQASVRFRVRAVSVPMPQKAGVALGGAVAVSRSVTA